MRLLPLLFAPLLCLSHAFADIVMVQDIETAGQKMTMTLKVKGDLTRVDVNPQMSMILDAKTGDMVNLMHGQKMFMKMNMESMKGMIDQMTQANTDIAAKSEIKTTGAKEKINGYDTEEYLVTKGGTVSHLWIAKDFPNYQTLMKATEAMRSGAFAKMIPQGDLDMKALPGMPIKTVVMTAGSETPTATVMLKSVEEKDLDPSEFAPPSDYTSFQMPSIPPPGTGQ